PQPLLAWAQNTPGIELPPTEYDTSTSVSVGPVVISEPAQFEMVSGLVEIRGNADDGLLPAERETSDQAIESFRIDFGRGSSPTEWQQIGVSQTEGGTALLLGAWDTSNLEDGLYTLRLTLERKDSSIEVANREVTVDNTPPAARFTSLEAGKTY